MRRGPSLKNTRFIKAGLTKEEKARVRAITAADKERWRQLLALNVWKEAKP